VADATAPDPVTSLTVAAQSDSSIKLDWVNSASADAQGVTILRKTGGVPTGTPVATTTNPVGTVIGDGTVVYVGTASTWTDTALTLELTTYGYSVFVRDVVPNYSARADGSDATLTDSTAPGNVTAQPATGDDGAVALAWTYPADLDVQGVLVLRSTAGTPGGTPSAGTTYTAGQSVGDGTVVYVGSGATPGGAGAWSDQGLVNGTHYYYKIFARDEHPNYASGGVAADATPAGPGSVKYVNGAMGAEGDGATWDTAFKTLTNALANAGSGDELRVAAGTYTPDVADGTRSKRFDMKSNVKIYGGFTSGMTYRYERNWTNNLTVLSGDLNGNDAANWGGRTDNSSNSVVYAADNVKGFVLDGFTVRGGYEAARGAGMYLGLSVSGLVANCYFTDNRAAAGYGGGMYVYSTVGMRVENCVFYTNSAWFGGGLASVPWLPCDLTLINCTIYGNTTEGNRGGGIYTQYVEPFPGWSVKNCIVAGNFTASGVPDNLRFRESYISALENSCVFLSLNTGLTWGTRVNNIEDTDPQFLNPAAGDFRLASSSPCIDMGASSGAPAKDIRGVARPVGNGIDIGAYAGPVYTVTVTPTAGATVRFNGQDYSASTVVPVDVGSYTASYTSPQAAGVTTQYVFSAWTLDGSAAGSSPATIVVSSANRVLNVTFTKRFKLALTVVGGAYGSVVGGSDGAWYDNGALLELDAQPLPRATFVGWTGCVGGQVTMDSAKSVTATFDSTDPTFIMFQ
jgi:hypothetical protein